ncbi:MAG: hypothetical protein JXA37_04520 [Chloroflexia bacterium]|nr:hypothetical protein [Chloroflexia bacterium]
MITKSEIDALTSYPPSDSPVVSFYISLDPHERAEKTTLTELKNLLKTGQEEMARWPEKDHVKIALNLARIEEIVENERGGQSRGLAIFAGEKIWQIYHLPLSAGQRVVIDRTPYVKPLIQVFRRHPRYCAVLVDKERARLFIVQMSEIQDYSIVLSEVPKHHEQGGWAQSRLQRRHDDYVMHHLKRSAELSFDFFQHEGFDYLLIGGTDELTSAFYERLHTYLQERVVGFLPISTSASVHDVLEQTLEVMQEVEARLHRELLEKLQEETGQGRLGVTGLSATLRAINAYKVQHLLLEEGYQTAGGRCSDCGNLTVRTTGNCRYCQGKIERVDKLIGEAVELAYNQGAQVHFIEANQVLWDMERIGALLRYA